MGCEFILVVFEEIGLRSFPLMKTGVELHFATAVTMSAGSYLMIRGLVPYDTKLAVWSPRSLSSLPRSAVCTFLKKVEWILH